MQKNKLNFKGLPSTVCVSRPIQAAIGQFKVTLTSNFMHMAAGERHTEPREKCWYEKNSKKCSSTPKCKV